VNCHFFKKKTFIWRTC